MTVLFVGFRFGANWERLDRMVYYAACNGTMRAEKERKRVRERERVLSSSSSSSSVGYFYLF